MQDVLDAIAADPTPYKILTGDFNTDQSITENYPMMKIIIWLMVKTGFGMIHTMELIHQ